jgi:transcriptional regulator with XRE-family HTH domain
MSEITPNGFGAALRRRREELGLSLNDLAASTRVHKTYLQALEEENLRMLPGTAYAVGFLRIYARELGLPVAPLLAALHGSAEHSSAAELPATGASHPPAARRKQHRGSGPRLLVWLCLLLLAVAGYVYWQPGKSPPAPDLPPPMVAPPQPSPAPPPAAPVAGQEPAATAAIELPVIPAGGAVVRMVPVAAGTMKVSLDNQEVREYQLQPEQSLNWKVSGSLACELSSPGLVRIWVGEDEVVVADHALFTLVPGETPAARP